MATKDEYKKRIVSALKKANRYAAGLGFQIEALAGAMRTLEIASNEIDKLDSTFVEVRSRYGVSYAEHPAFKVQKNAQDSITKQLKQLCLTTEDLADTNEDDPMIEMTKKVQAAGKARIVKPKGKTDKSE